MVKRWLTVVLPSLATGDVLIGGAGLVVTGNRSAARCRRRRLPGKILKGAGEARRRRRRRRRWAAEGFAFITEISNAADHRGVICRNDNELEALMATPPPRLSRTAPGISVSAAAVAVGVQANWRSCGKPSTSEAIATDGLR